MPGKSISCAIICNTDIHKLWNAWTTETGAVSFFAPACKIEPFSGGAYEMYFDLKAEPGMQGGEGMRILAIQPVNMISFTWNAPPHLSRVRGQKTVVIVYLDAVSEHRTRCSLYHTGWGEGGEWDLAFDYFTTAWKKIVLPRLKYRFDHGPIDWDNPPVIR